VVKREQTMVLRFKKKTSTSWFYIFFENSDFKNWTWQTIPDFKL